VSTKMVGCWNRYRQVSVNSVAIDVPCNPDEQHFVALGSDQWLISISILYVGRLGFRNVGALKDPKHGCFR